MDKVENKVVECKKCKSILIDRYPMFCLKCGHTEFNIYEDKLPF